MISDFLFRWELIWFWRLFGLKLPSPTSRSLNTLKSVRFSRGMRATCKVETSASRRDRYGRRAHSSCKVHSACPEKGWAASGSSSTRTYSSAAVTNTNIMIPPQRPVFWDASSPSRPVPVLYTNFILNVRSVKKSNRGLLASWMWSSRRRREITKGNIPISVTSVSGFRFRF